MHSIDYYVPHTNSFLGCKILQLFCGYSIWHMYFIIINVVVVVVVYAFTVMFLVFSESMKLFGLICNNVISFFTHDCLLVFLFSNC